MVYVTCFTLKEKNIHAVFLWYLFVAIFLPQCYFSFLADFLTVFWKGISYCHKMPRLTCCRDPKSSLICTNINFMRKQSCSSAWRKITTIHCEFNIWLLYLIFKSQCQTTKTRLIGEVVYELNTVIRLSSLKKRGIRLYVVRTISNAFRASPTTSFLVV